METTRGFDTALKELISSFDDEVGLGARAFEATADLIQEAWGIKAAQTFCRGIDGSEDRYCPKDGMTGGQLAQRVFDEGIR